MRSPPFLFADVLSDIVPGCFDRDENTSSRIPVMPAARTKMTGDISKNHDNSVTARKMHKVSASLTELLKSLTTALNMRMQTQTRISANAFCTAGTSENAEMHPASAQIMTREGDTTPRVAIMPPITPSYLYPMKVAVFTAMTPGVH